MICASRPTSKSQADSMVWIDLTVKLSCLGDPWFFKVLDPDKLAIEAVYMHTTYLSSRQTPGGRRKQRKGRLQ